MTDALGKCLSIRDLQRRARRHLPRMIYDYLEGGADDDECLVRNEQRIRTHTLRPRYLVDIGTRSQEVTVFGRTYASPFDSGIRRGSDIAVAMALGARLCFVGRAAGYGGASTARTGGGRMSAAPSRPKQALPCRPCHGLRSGPSPGAKGSRDLACPGSARLAEQVAGRRVHP